MKKIVIILSIVLLTSSLLACVSTTNKGSHESTATVQTTLMPTWNEREISILESLSLYNYTPVQDESNHVVNNSEAAKLGKKLFFDTRFSADGTISCASCHKPELYFTDGMAQAAGIFKTTRNAPTIVGSSNNNWFFLDGRTDSLWSQALHPVENTLEHRSSRSQFAHVIFNDPELKPIYENVFGPMPDISDKSRFPENAGPIRIKPIKAAWKNMTKADKKIITNIFVNGGKAIAAYETQIQPSPSRFDNYVAAISERNSEKMQNLLSEDETAGLKIFLDKGKCFICHNGPTFSDMSFHNIATPPLNVKKYDYGRSKGVRRVKKNPFNCLSEHNDSLNKSCDELKYIVFHEEETLAAFKTPSLRNVTKTAPYMHAGQYKTLSEVIKHYNDPPPTKVGMNKLLDIDLSNEEMKQLEAFLNTLDSEIDTPPGWFNPNE